MLTGVQVLQLGGDARQLEVIKKLVELDATVTVCGFDGLLTSLDGAVHAEFEEGLLEDVDALLLPAVGMDDQGYVHTVFSDRQIQLTESQFSKLPKRCTVYAGMANDYLKKLCKQQQLKLVELFARDDVAIYNSIPTAEGALMMAIQHTEITIHGSNSMVLGLGRTGFTLARTLQGLGAKVQVGIRRSEHFARALEMGFEPFYISSLLQQVGRIDLLFNTIPTMIVTAQIIANLPSRAVIIDLASKPGGTDFRFAEKRGIKAMLAPGLPGIVAPKTAGRIIADCLGQLIKDETNNRGNGL